MMIAEKLFKQGIFTLTQQGSQDCLLWSDYGYLRLLNVCWTHDSCWL